MIIHKFIGTLTMTHRLSSLEEYFFYRSSWNLHSCFYTGIKLNKLPTKLQISYALQRTIKHFSPLYSNVQTKSDNDTNDPVLYIIPFQVELIRFKDVVDYKDWDELNTESVNSIFKEYNFTYFKERPLWKLLIVPKLNTLILAVDHVLSDGIGTVKFWQYFIKNLGPQSDNTDNPILFQPESLSLPTNISIHPYDRWPISRTWKLKRLAVPYLVKYFPNAVTSLNPQFLQFNQYAFPGDLLEMELSKPFDYKVKNSNIRHILNVPYPRLRSILNNCKKKQVSLTSYITAVFAIVLNDKINDKKDSTNNGSKFKIDIPMNTREACQSMLKLDSSLIQMGNFVAGLEIEIDRSELINIWKVAQIIQSNISKFIKANINDTIQQVKLLDVVQIENFILPKIYNEGPSGTFEITNLGLQEFNSDYDEFIVEDAIFDEPQGISDIFTCSGITTEKGGMNISVSIPKTINDELSSLLDDVKKYF